MANLTEEDEWTVHRWQQVRQGGLYKEVLPGSDKPAPR